MRRGSIGGKNGSMSKLRAEDQEKIEELREAFEAVPLEVKAKAQKWSIKIAEVERECLGFRV